jgi:hypothetical protein
VTERKPAGKSWESWREELIQRAHEEGAFDNLPSAGKPLADLGESYDPDWWVKKLVQREKISMLPPSLELCAGRGRNRADLEAFRRSRCPRAIRALNAEIARVNARAKAPTRLAPLEADTIVAEWRAARKSGPPPR